ncbi:MAG: DUF192 domain-containing protein [Candidatus Dojkabacteria bacterium]
MSVNNIFNKLRPYRILVLVLIVPLSALIGIFFLTAINTQTLSNPPLAAPLKQTTVTITTADGKEIKIDAEVADTDTSRIEGLMNRDSLPDNAGMLFIFDQESTLSFWMKNTLIPLDIIFADRNGVINTIYQNTLPNSSVPHYVSSAPSLFALEVNGGLTQTENISVGDVIDF